MKSTILIALVLIVVGFSANASDCKNLVKDPYIKSPSVYGPQNTLGKGIRIWMGGKLVDIPDTRPKCLPIPLRYNNPGAMKTRKSGYWPGQINKDSKGHAVFSTLGDGVVALGEWFKTKHNSGKKYSAYDIMEIYAPSKGCVGDIGIPPTNCKYGLNPTEKYADRVAKSVGKTYREPLNLNGSDCKEGREAMYALITEIATFEIGANFCGKENKNSLASCSIDRNLFDESMDKVFGPVNSIQCANPTTLHDGKH